eukprot:10318098-Heterocapsa_arctica.AAC.1
MGEAVTAAVAAIRAAEAQKADEEAKDENERLKKKANWEVEWEAAYQGERKKREAANDKAALEFHLDCREEPRKALDKALGVFRAFDREPAAEEHKVMRVGVSFAEEIKISSVHPKDFHEFDTGGAAEMGEAIGLHPGVCRLRDKCQ